MQLQFANAAWNHPPPPPPSDMSGKKFRGTGRVPCVQCSFSSYKEAPLLPGVTFLYSHDAPFPKSIYYFILFEE